MIKKHLLVVLCWTFLFCSCGKGYKDADILESWQAQNDKFKIKVTSFNEWNPVGLVNGAYYVSKSAPLQSDKWVEIMTFRHDDPDPINREGVNFVNEDTAFVYMVRQFAVTTDAGNNWTVWDASKDKNLSVRLNYEIIKNVKIRADGSGEMLLQSISSGEPSRTLFTIDYGRTWTSQR